MKTLKQTDNRQQGKKKIVEERERERKKKEENLEYENNRTITKYR